MKDKEVARENGKRNLGVDDSASEAALKKARKQLNAWRSAAAEMKARRDHGGDLGKQVLELHKAHPVLPAQGAWESISSATITIHVRQWTLVQQLLGARAPQWLIDVGQTDWRRVHHKTLGMTRSQMSALRTSFRRVMEYVGKQNLVSDAIDPDNQGPEQTSPLFSHIQSIPSGLGSDAQRIPALRRAFGNELWASLCVDLPLLFGLAPAQIERLRPKSCFLGTHVALPPYRAVGEKSSKVMFAETQIEYSSDPEWRERQIAAARRLIELFGDKPIGPCMGSKRFQKNLRERLTEADRLAREPGSHGEGITFTRLHGEFFRYAFRSSFPVDIEKSLKVMDALAVRKREVPLREAFLDAYQQCGRVHAHLRDVAPRMSEQESSARWWARRLRGLFPAAGELGVQECWLAWCPADREPYIGTAFTLIAQSERRLSASDLDKIAQLAQQRSGARAAVLPWYEEQVPTDAVRIFKRRAWF